VGEAVEYFVLDRLSTILTDYFNRNANIDSQEVVSLERKDIPSVLLSNRFLELFSRPMDEREPFLDNRREGAMERLDGVATKIVSAHAGGAYFDNFDLTLPRGSAISRGENHSISMSTRRFSLRLETMFDGFMTVLPRRFEKLYLGERYDKLGVYKVELKIEMKLRLRTLLSRRGWQYFQWIDLFIDRMEADFSFDRFVLESGWNVAFSVAKVIQHLSPTGGRQPASESAKQQDLEPNT
jgi:hypothetical protein